MLTHLQYPDYESMSEQAATMLAEALILNPRLVVCMASGHTPARTAELWVKKIMSSEIDYRKMRFIGLDEWVGLHPANEGSCRYFFEQKIVRPLQLDPSQYYMFDGLATDLNAECGKMDSLIAKTGIDLMVVGIGMNGHIGFNEPGTPFDQPCHVAELDETTITIGQKYFTEPTELAKGITVGFLHLMRAKQLVIMAEGLKKAGVVQKALEGPVGPAFPASILRTHPNAVMITDFAAASLIGVSQRML